MPGKAENSAYIAGCALQIDASTQAEIAHLGDLYLPKHDYDGLARNVTALLNRLHPTMDILVVHFPFERDLITRLAVIVGGRLDQALYLQNPQGVSSCFPPSLII